MNDKFLLKKSGGRILLAKTYEAVFPNKCLFCGRVLDHIKAVLCGDCAKSAKFGMGVIPEHICRVYVAYEYEQEARNTIFRFKYEGKRLLAKPMARMIFERFGKIMDYDFLVPVPLYVARAKERGFNQAALLATELSGLMGLPAYDGMIRAKDTKQQFQLGFEERIANMANAFGIKEGFEICGKNILLVDDILTTGATAAECAKVLKDAGAKSVSLIVFAGAVGDVQA